jgi:glycosyltransferase involved in cell wall biosynthesis
LHAHTPRTAMIASIVARCLGLPWVYHVHSPTARDSTRALQNWINDWVERLALRSADRIITVSKSLRRETLRRGYDRHRVVAIANGVAEQEPNYSLERIESSAWRLGMVALIRPRKGIEVLLEALKLVAARHTNVSLDVIGSFETKEYEAEVMALTARLGLAPSVRWRGFTRDVQGALRELDALVLPSLFGEGMPMVVLEALAVGLPVIATSVEGTPEVIRDGREGYLAKPRDPSSLAASIERLIANRQVWNEMSHLAWTRHRESFSDRHMAERVASTYQRMLQERQPRPATIELPRGWASPQARRLRSFLVEA